MKTLYIVIVHLMLLLFVTYFAIGNSGKRENQAKVDYYIDSLNAFHYYKNSQIKQRRNFALGDSLIQAIDEDGLYSNVTNWGVGHSTSHDLHKKVSNLSSLKNADTIFILIGINDIHRGIPIPTVIENIKQIVDELRLSKKIVLVSLLPVGIDRKTSVQIMAKIKNLNSAIKNLSASHKNAKYLDAHCLFTNRKGFLNSTFDRGDGLHLNAVGNKLLLEIFNKELISE